MHSRLVRDLSVSVALIFLILVGYFSAYDKEFVYFDDPGYVTDNLDVQKGLTPDSIYWSFTAFVQSNWHPLTWISHQTDIQLYGLKHPGGHHVTNLILHTFNVLLVFWLFRLLTGRTWCCAAIAALFAVHPMHVESVIWVAERKDVLSTFLGLLTFVAYIYYARKADFKLDTWATVSTLTLMIGFLAITWFGLKCNVSDTTMTPIGIDNSTLWIVMLLGSVFMTGMAALAWSAIAGRPHVLLYYIIFILFVLGLLAKPMLVTLPFVCLLLDFWPLNRMFGAATAKDLPFFNLNGSNAENDGDSNRQRTSSADRSGAPRRKLRRNQKLPGGQATATRRRPVASSSATYGSASDDQGPDIQLMLQQAMAHVVHFVLLVLEKTPLFILTYISCRITPYAQEHGGSMATPAELPWGFRIQNAIQAYFVYLKKMFWPGQMTSLYLLDRDSNTNTNVDFYKTLAVIGVVIVVAGALALGIFLGRRFLNSRWFAFTDLLLPLLGIGTTLYFLNRFINFNVDPNIANNTSRTSVAAAALVMMTGFVLWTLCTGRRYLAFGWFWYIGILVPVIGIVQVGEQAIADRYTYVPYIGIFLMFAFCIGELIDAFQDMPRAAVMLCVALATTLLITICTCWSWNQENHWRTAEAHLDHALTMFPTNWNMLNNKGVKLWEHSQEAEALARKAAAEGRGDDAQRALQTSEDFKKKAIDTWETGIKARPTATDIWSNLGYAYSERATKEKALGHMDLFVFYLKKAQDCLEKAVYLKPISPRPRNNLGRVYLVLAGEAKAKAAEAKAKQDDANAKKLSDEGDRYEAAAIAQFREAINLDPTLLEAHANLAQVYFSLARYDESEAEYKAMLSYDTPNASEDKRQTFASAWLGLAQIAMVHQKPAEVQAALIQAIKKNPMFVVARRDLAKLYIDNGKTAEAEDQLWAIMRLSSPADRVNVWRMFAGMYINPDPSKIDPIKNDPMHPKEIGVVFTLMSWALATSPSEVDPASNKEFSMRNGPAAIEFGRIAVRLTNQQDPRALDSLAAAFAENSQFNEAVQAGTLAASLAQQQGKAALATEIRKRVALYSAKKAYRSKIDGSDRP